MGRPLSESVGEIGGIEWTVRVSEGVHFEPRDGKLHFKFSLSPANDPKSRLRDGGKPAAAKLLKPVKAHGKRAKFLRWFLDDPTGRTVGAAMANFGMKRPNVLAYWTAIQRDHGIGYALSNNTITALLPPNTKPAAIFGAKSDGA